MDAKEIREKTADELVKLEAKLRQELAGFKIQARAGQLAETSKIGSMKRDIARILTIRSQGGITSVTVASSASPKPAKEKAPKAGKADKKVAKKTEGRTKK